MKYWKTKTGEKIAIKDMETSHIENCIRMLKRLPDQGIEADAAEGFGFNLSASVMRAREEKAMKQIQAFQRELKRRGVEAK